jgi:uncharacterized membrane protein
MGDGRRLDTAFEQTTRAGDIGLRGLWLLFLYVSIVGLVLLSLAAHQFQARVIERNAEAQAGRAQAITLPTLLSLRVEYEAHLQRLEAAEQDLRGAEEQLIAAERALAEASAAREGSRLAMAGAAVSLGPEVELSADPETIDTRIVADMLARAKVRLARDPDAEGLSDLAQAARQALDEFGTAARTEAEAFALFFARQETQRTHQERLHARRQTLEEFGASVGQGTVDLLNELIAYRNFKPLVFYLEDPVGVASLPRDLLTLFVTLMMGALGSVLFVTRTYLQQGDERGFAWYLFRPFLGMITALAVFVAFKAGQLTLGGVTTDQPLNPFLLSFVAIISGLLSEQAIERLARIGGNMFRGDQEAGGHGQAAEAAALPSDARVAPGLAAVMSAAATSAAQLAEALGVSEAEVASWREGTPVPHAQQDALAAALGLPPRVLFGG